MILKNGKIYTMDGNNNIAEAVAIKDGKIIATGSNEEILKKYKTDNIIDLEGKTVLPGFTDSHGHILGLGIKLSTLDLTNAKSPEEIAGRISEKIKTAKPGEWIIGRGWDQNTWTKKQFPTHDVLDRAAPDNPVFLIRVDGHAIWVNIEAMIAAGITPDTPEPEGGKILKTGQGEPTGVFIDNAIALVEKVRPAMTKEQNESAIINALNECAKAGLTEVHDMGISQETIDIYKKLIDERKMPIRIIGFIEGKGRTWDKYKQSGKEIYGTDQLTIAGIKLFMDGALGSRGAALVEAYSDEPGNRGLTLMTESELTEVTKEALNKDLQVAIHCIGDRANNIALNAFEKALKDMPRKDPRLRIEHSQILLPGDIKRFKEIGIIPSMQPVHATSDMYWAELRLGKERIKHAYAWKELLNCGSVIPGGSDFPVEDFNPILGIYAACTRKDINGRPESWQKDSKYFSFNSHDIDTTQFRDGWYANQKMSREEALKSFTIWGAYAARQENIKGSIEKGKYADLVVLSGDITKTDDKNIPGIQVIMTIVNGQVVYKTNDHGK
jgi:predicted amidohydrolase YtcJ